ncbi:MAG: hypothetical protein Q7Q71_14095 [Verrucomicrobiota bacterium JB023]|nr:hypothetical protein [Verrucomicrobiota bacterium JB023]
MKTITDSEATSPAWQSLEVRNLLRAEQQRGHHPTRLLLGNREANSLRSYLSSHFDEGTPPTLADTYYLGMKVEVSLSESQLVFLGEKRHPAPEDDLGPEDGVSNQESPEEPDFTIPSELRLYHHWDSEALRDLIDTKTSNNRKPAYLFLGRHEAFLLRRHLKAAFGPESVRSLKNLYYMGLEVVEVDTDYFLRTVGMKRVQSFRELTGKNQPRWKDITSGSVWQPSFFG